MLIGYARVSTHEQTLDLQIDALKEAGCEKIYEDKITSIADTRPGLEKAFEIAREGDTFVVWRLDRLGRSTIQLIDVVNDIKDRGIDFKSLKENIDTTTPGGKLIFHVFAALAEYERGLIKERTKAGLEAARARGRKGGRPPAIDPGDTKKLRRLYALYDSKQHTIEEIRDIMGISKTTLYGYINQRKSRDSKDDPTSSR